MRIVILVAICLVGCSSGTNPSPSSDEIKGMSRELGMGDVYSFATLTGDGKPAVLGVSISQEALDNPPPEMTDGNRCFDHDADGTINQHEECSPWHERALPLPPEVSNRTNVPFSWVLLNWNNHGHIPPGIWDAPHFDVHFYIAPIEEVFSWQRGPCGPEFLRCDQFEIATQPVPPGLMHPDYTDVGAAAPAMGNHLVDTTAKEFHGEPFTRSWIYGVYGGEVIFYEEMVAQDFLKTKPDACFDLKSPERVALSGFYPTQTCSRFNSTTNRTTISLEQFEYREAALN